MDINKFTALLKFLTPPPSFFSRQFTNLGILKFTFCLYNTQSNLIILLPFSHFIEIILATHSCCNDITLYLCVKLILWPCARLTSHCIIKKYLRSENKMHWRSFNKNHTGFTLHFRC